MSSARVRFSPEPPLILVAARKCCPPERWSIEAGEESLLRGGSDKPKDQELSARRGGAFGGVAAGSDGQIPAVDNLVVHLSGAANPEKR